METSESNKFVIDRRKFISGALAGALGVAATSALAGCAPKSTTSAQSSSSSSATKAKTAADYKISATKEADVVVVGAGGCGCSASTRAAQLGLNTVLIEKMSTVGGTSRYTEGLFAIGSRLQKESGIDISAEEIITKAMNYHHWIPNQYLYETYFNASAANFDWMESLGIGFETATQMGASERTWHVYKIDQSGIPGNLYMDTWGKVVEKAGVDTMFNTTAETLLTDSGKVSGIIVKGNDNTYTQINAPVVIMATGGYSDSADYIRDVAGYDPDRVMAMGAGTRTGDGMTMAKSAGGEYAPYPGTVMFYGGNLPGIMFGSHLFAATSFQPLLWVNQDGKRFTNEMFSNDNFSYSGNAQVKQKRVLSILTKSQMDMFVNQGSIYACAQYVARGDKLTKLWDEYNEQVKAGNSAIFQADSIKELAQKAGLDADALQQTISTYNGYCAAGKDEEFGKNPEYLLPLDQGPYYAFDLKVGYFTTVGGLKVNTNAQVLDESDEPIPGLYAGGSDAGGLYGDTYDVIICAGSQQGWAVHSGKTAAEHAKTYLGK